MRTILFISTLLLFVGCGSDDSKETTPSKQPVVNIGDRPASPITEKKEQTPPSLPAL